MTIPPNPHPEQVEALALVILNSDRSMAGLPPVDSRGRIPDSDGYVANATAVLASLANRPADDGGWIVGNGDGGLWRTWGVCGPDWTPERDKATRYHRREDAETVHAEDEDAWRVEPYAPPQPEGVKRP